MLLLGEFGTAGWVRVGCGDAGGKAEARQRGTAAQGKQGDLETGVGERGGGACGAGWRARASSLTEAIWCVRACMSGPPPVTLTPPLPSPGCFGSAERKKSCGQEGGRERDATNSQEGRPPGAKDSLLSRLQTTAVPPSLRTASEATGAAAAVLQRAAAAPQARPRPFPTPAGATARPAVSQNETERVPRAAARGVRASLRGAVSCTHLDGPGRGLQDDLEAPAEAVEAFVEVWDLEGAPSGRLDGDERVLVGLGELLRAEGGGGEGAAGGV